MKDQINHILDKYWEGASSLEEEKLLKQYFTSDQVAEEHKIYASMFQFFDKQSDITYTLPELSTIQKKAETDIPVKRLTFFKKYMYAIAAVFTLVVASLFFWNINQIKNETPSYVQEIEDPEEAYRITMQALAMVSGKLNKGTESIALGMDNVTKANIFK